MFQNPSSGLFSTSPAAARLNGGGGLSSGSPQFPPVSAPDLGGGIRTGRVRPPDPPAGSAGQHLPIAGYGSGPRSGRLSRLHTPAAGSLRRWLRGRPRYGASQGRQNFLPFRSFNIATSSMASAGSLFGFAFSLKDIQATGGRDRRRWHAM